MRNWQPFPVRGQIVNISGFAGHAASVQLTQPAPDAGRSTDNAGAQRSVVLFTHWRKTLPQQELVTDSMTTLALLRWTGNWACSISEHTCT